MLLWVWCLICILYGLAWYAFTQATWGDTNWRMDMLTWYFVFIYQDSQSEILSQHQQPQQHEQPGLGIHSPASITSSVTSSVRRPKISVPRVPMMVSPMISVPTAAPAAVPSKARAAKPSDVHSDDNYQLGTGVLGLLWFFL